MLIRHFIYAFLLSGAFEHLKAFEFPNECDLSSKPLDQSYNYSDLSMIREVYKPHVFYTSILVRKKNIREIPQSTFAQLCVITIDLTDNQIESISDRSFADIANLYELILVKNRIWSLSSFFQALNVESLVYLDLSNNLIRTITNISNVKNIEKLTKFYLSFNNIEHIDDFAFEMFSGLKELDLNGNFLAYISNLTFGGLVNLKSLYLEHNLIRYIDTGAFAQLSSLKTLILTKNEIEAVNEWFGNDSPLILLKLNLNKISSVHPRALSRLASLNELYFIKNRLDMSIMFVGLRKLTTLRLDYNNLKILSKNMLNGLVSIKEIFFTQSKVEAIEKVFIKIK